MMLILFYLLTAFTKGVWPVCNGYSCSSTFPCKSTAWTYSSCFNSCYLVYNTAAGYLSALKTCMVADSQFFVPNDASELAFVMANVPGVMTSKQYWLGLQDWVRRGAGSTSGSWNVSSGYQNDPDGVWHWLDESPTTIVASSFLPATFGSYGGYESSSAIGIPWKSVPVTGTDFIAYLEYINLTWGVSLASNFSDSKAYICEYSVACASCPSNMWKYMSNCYLYNTAASFSTAVTNCANINPPYSFLWTARNEALVAYLRLITDLFGAAIWLGLSRSSSIAVWEWSNNSSMILPSDPFDVATTLPGLTHLAFKVVPDTLPLGNIFIPSDGFSASTGWVSTATASFITNLYLCQMPSTSLLVTSTAPTTTSTPTTTTETTTVSIPESTTTVPQTTLMATTTVPESTTSSNAATTSTTGAATTTITVPETTFSSSTLSTTQPTSSAPTTSSVETTAITAMALTTTAVVPTQAVPTLGGGGGASCGDGKFQPSGEQCDDGNTQPGDGCSPACTLEYVDRSFDVYFVVDTSEEVPFMQFDKVRSFLQSIVSQLVLDGPSASVKDSVQVGIIVFGGRTAGFRLMTFDRSAKMEKAEILETVEKMVYFGSPGNLSNALGRLIDGNTFSYADGSRVGRALSVAIVISSSSSIDSTQFDQQLAVLNSYARRVLLVSIGGKVKQTQLARFSHYGFLTIEIAHWNLLQSNVHQPIKFLLTIT